MSEKEAEELGFVKDKKGNWVHARKASVQRCGSSKVPKLEPGSVVEKKGSDAAKRKNASSSCRRYRIVVTAHCRRHTDPDNLCPKWFIDRLKEFNIIPDDSSEFVDSFVKRVKKVECWEPEVTIIEVFELGAEE